MNQPMIQAENLTKRYGSFTALDHLSFEVAPGESLALWGANGAGKTTALRCLLGVHAFEGRLTINGIDVRRDGKAARAAVGYLPQEATFYDLPVYQTLEFYARLKKVSRERIDAVLEQVQLAPHRRKSVRALSGGMKQRLALAVALLSQPPVLVLDEPTASLDVHAQGDFIQLIQSLSHAGKSIVFSTHRIDEVQALGGRVLVLDQGRRFLECLPRELPERLGLRRWLRIWVDASRKDDSVRLLNEHGFSATPNGHSIFVRVQGPDKMTPLRTLEKLDIPVQDFELVEGEGLEDGETHA